MKCNYLNVDEVCTASPTSSTHYKPNVEEKQNFCFNDLEIRTCPRLQIYHDHLELIKTKNELSVQNVNSNVNVNTNLAFNQQVADDFSRAYNEVERRDISDEIREEINIRLTALEAELKKENPNKGRIQRFVDWFKNNANWIFPAIPHIVEAVKKAIGA